MPTFGELLSQFIARAGITDAELARSTGVQRQTIFRWKEGLTARPRYREDVIRIAAKLRLSPGERDALLLAAGFPPDEPIPADALSTMFAANPETPTETPPETATETATETDIEAAGETGMTAQAQPPAEDRAPAKLAAEESEATAAPPARRTRLIERPGVLLATAAILMLVVAIVGTVALRAFNPFALTPAQTPAASAPVTATPTPAPTESPTTIPIVAQPGDHLIVIAPFVGYTSTDLRFNVAGRIREALEEELSNAQLTEMRVAVWPEPVSESAQADAVLQSSRAVLVIWGEYDAGRVRAGLSTPAMEDAYWINPVDAPASLPFVINQNVPRDVRIFALYTLGSYYRTNEDNARSLAVYRRALAQAPTDPSILASIHFYIGLLTPLVEGYTVTSLTDSIYHYTKTLALQPAWENARYKRGTSYLGRALLSLDERADLDAAIADLTVVVQRYPGRTDPLLNRGIAYYQRNDAGDLDAARADFTRAIALAPTDHQAYYHRALVDIRRGDAASWQADLTTAAELAPDYAPIQNAFCWGYGVTGAPDTALPFCDAAVAADPTGSSLDSRAITLAQLSRHADAAADLRAYLTWVQTAYPALYAKYRGPRVEQWIEALDRGENPFTPDVLDSLRRGVD